MKKISYPSLLTICLLASTVTPFWGAESQKKYQTALEIKFDKVTDDNDTFKNFFGSLKDQHKLMWKDKGWGILSPANYYFLVLDNQELECDVDENGIQTQDKVTVKRLKNKLNSLFPSFLNESYDLEFDICNWVGWGWGQQRMSEDQELTSLKFVQQQDLENNITSRYKAYWSYILCFTKIEKRATSRDDSSGNNDPQTNPLFIPGKESMFFYAAITAASLLVISYIYQKFRKGPASVDTADPVPDKGQEES